MRILIYLYSLGAGGAERVVSTLANHWVSEGHQVRIVTLTDTATDFYRLDPRIERLGLGLARESRRLIGSIHNTLTRIRAVRKAIRSFQPRVAISMMDSANVILA